MVLLLPNTLIIISSNDDHALNAHSSALLGILQKSLPRLLLQSHLSASYGCRKRRNSPRTTWKTKFDTTVWVESSIWLPTGVHLSSIHHSKTFPNTWCRVYGREVKVKSLSFEPLRKSLKITKCGANMVRSRCAMWWTYVCTCSNFNNSVVGRKYDWLTFRIP